MELELQGVAEETNWAWIVARGDVNGEGKRSPEAGQWLAPQTDQNYLTTYKLCLKLFNSSKPTP